MDAIYAPTDRTASIGRRLASAIATVAVTTVVAASVVACSHDVVVDAGCDLTAPLIEGIATALGAVAEIGPAAAIAGGIAGVVVSKACKELFAQDTTPQSNDRFLKEDPLVPNQFRLPSDATVCLPGSGRFASVAAGTTVTTCQFSKNVRQAFLQTGIGTVSAYSPVTDVWYDMDCAGDYPVACTGGKNALVYIY
ncbi:hypothetical protein Mycch_3865 [Mycolicibacterium chubuense NBB4]|uniref:Uncharacterized protein n=1 Tax=Mycolicibacterium chubuense (strain NBB4) TaxID=710421 RepID=I4BMT3_MYCCN|nr:hypothetical protein [Mycolicibacterium chubuense]AFM18590.1 hypothetical protein Mycch_3865 [Mycolicibacterium chubuense NBB4]